MGTPQPGGNSGPPPARRRSRFPASVAGRPGAQGVRGGLEGSSNLVKSAFPTTLGLFIEGDTNDFYYAIWSRGGTLLRHSTNAPADLSRPGRPTRPLRPRADAGLEREAFQFTELGECVLAGRSIRSDLEATRRFAGWLVAAGGAVLALGWGRLAARQPGLAPPGGHQHGRQSDLRGNLSERINVADTDSELAGWPAC